MVHYLTYADIFDTEGLLSSPPHKGRKKDRCRSPGRLQTTDRRLQVDNPTGPSRRPPPPIRHRLGLNYRRSPGPTRRPYHQKQNPRLLHRMLEYQER
jgi:hypothetical protein